ncbi:MAG: phage minor head protein [Pirellulales bacterium]
MEEFFDEEEESKTWSILFLPFLLLGFRKGIDLGLKQGPGTTKPEDVFTASVRQALEGRSLDHASKTIGTTKEALQGELKAAIEGGESVKQLAKRIDQLYGQQMGYRSVRIARTELTGVVNEGTVKTLAREGFTQKEWSTVIDGRERPTHADANGQVVGINDFFRVGGASCAAPGDPILPVSELVNCRCICVGAGLQEDRRKAIGREFLRLHGAIEYRFVVSLRRAFSEQRNRVLSQFPPL